MIIRSEIAKRLAELHPNRSKLLIKALTDNMFYHLTKILTLAAELKFAGLAHFV